MSETQRDYYDDATEIGSDPFHILDRDNRNHRKKQDIILEHVTADDGERILEVGCGHGLHAPGYAKRYEYTGVDISKPLLEQTRRQVNAVADSWTVRQDDAMNLDWADDEFGAVVGTAILHHLENPRSALQEWIRVTRPGGSVTLMEPNYYFPKDLAETHLIDAERNKVNIRPSVIGDVCSDVAADDNNWMVEPHIYTPPWPTPLHGVYDRLDATLQSIPFVRLSAQMLLIHIDVK